MKKLIIWFNENVNSLLEDKHGNIWLASDTGISMFNPEDKTVQEFWKKIWII